MRDRLGTFRELHADGLFLLPNPWDAGSAKLLASLGFEALATTSAGLAWTLGRRDGEGAVSRDEALEHARTIVEATDLPVSADLENGFGDDPAAVAETVRRAAAVGLCGCSIEDATGDPARPIYDAKLAAERIAAAVEAARAAPHPFVLVARAENHLHGRANLDDTLRRLQSFAAAGADCLYAPGLPDVEAIRAVCAAVAPRPVNALAGASFSVASLSAAGVRRISLGSALSRAALGGFLRAAREIAEKGTFTFASEAPPFDQIQRAMATRG